MIAEHKDLADRLAKVIRQIPDFPRTGNLCSVLLFEYSRINLVCEGILFRDISTLLADPKLWKDTIDALVTHYKDKGVQKIAGI